MTLGGKLGLGFSVTSCVVLGGLLWGSADWLRWSEWVYCLVVLPLGLVISLLLWLVVGTLIFLRSDPAERDAYLRGARRGAVC